MPKLPCIKTPPTLLKDRRIVVIGIDPGSSGGLASIDAYGNVEAVPMPDTEQDIWTWVSGIAGRTDVFGMIEQVGGFMGGGEKGGKNIASGHTMFTFGKSYGLLRMALIAAGIPFDQVTPQKWQKALGISPKDKTESKTEFKNRLKQKAQQLFPSVKITLATADALLITEYCMRIREGKL